MLTMPLESIAALMVASFLVKLAPGPGALATVGIALSRGARPGVTFVSGIVLGDMAYVVTVLLGLSVIAKEFHELFFAIRILGGCYLIYLGYHAFFSKPAPTQPNAPKTPNQLKLFLNGFLVTLANPKVILFYVGLLPTFIDIANLTSADMFLLTVLMVTDTGLILSAYVVAANRARRLFTESRSLRRLNRASGLVLSGAGIGVITTS